MTYRVTLNVNVREYWASVEDFLLAIKDFNDANKDTIEVEVKKIEEIDGNE